MRHYFGSIWFWWIFLSLLYIGLNFIGYPMEVGETEYDTQDMGVTIIVNSQEIPLSALPSRDPLEYGLSYVAAFVGLFVPYGMYSFFHFMASYLSWISVPIFLGLMYLANNKIKSLILSNPKKILIILLALLLITTIIDFVRGTPFESWTILFQGGFPHYCC